MLTILHEPRALVDTIDAHGRADDLGPVNLKRLCSRLFCELDHLKGMASQVRPRGPAEEVILRLLEASIDLVIRLPILQAADQLSAAMFEDTVAKLRNTLGAVEIWAEVTLVRPIAPAPPPAEGGRIRYEGRALNGRPPYFLAVLDGGRA